MGAEVRSYKVCQDWSAVGCEKQRALVILGTSVSRFPSRTGHSWRASFPLDCMLYPVQGGKKK